MRDGFELVAAFIDAAVEPVNDGVSARLGVVEILHADDVAIRREIDFDGIVTAAERVPGDVGAVGPATPDTAGKRFIDQRAVLLHHLVAFATVAPVEASIRMQERAVDVCGVAGVVEAAHDHFTLVSDAVVVGVRQLPDAGRGADVETAVQPASSLWKRHLVGEDGALVEAAILVGVFEHEDAVWRVRFKLRLVPVHAHGIANEETALVIETAHDGMRDEGGGCGDFEGVAIREVVLRQWERGLARDDDRPLATLRDGTALIRGKIGGKGWDS